MTCNCSSSACTGGSQAGRTKAIFGTSVGILAGFGVLLAMFGFAQPATDDGAGAAKPETKETTPVIVRLETSKGNIDIELNQEKAPISVANFLEYVDKGHYNGTIFHRVIPNFMVQGGGFDTTMTQKPTGNGIKNEWQNGLSNVRGSVAMARLGNQPDSATAQFFINVTDNAFLDEPRDGAGYAVFAKVTEESMAVVDAIRVVPTTTKGPHGNVPVEPVVIKKASRLTEESEG
jgi:cyclophilin family peptidyl-prolyl cis-trans isomerase